MTRPRRPGSVAEVSAEVPEGSVKASAQHFHGLPEVSYRPEPLGS